MDKYQTSGLTWVSLLAGLFSIFVFIPANIYLRLMTGQRIEVSMFAMLLFVEMGRLLGRRISRQEAYMISFLAGMGAFVPLDMVYRVYFRNSDVVKGFGFADEIPTWWVPPPESNVQITRTFFHGDWLIPFALSLINYPVLVVALAISIALLLKDLYIDVMKLPFPLQQVTAQQIVTVSEGEESALDLLFTASVFGFVWGFVVYALPNVIRSYTGRLIQFVPIPWYDFTSEIEPFFPGAMFGVLTDLSPVIMAFVLSQNMIISMIVGSFAVWFFGNSLLVKYDLSLQRWWLPGLSSEFIYSRSTLYFWAVPLIGFSLAAGLMPVFRHPARFYRALTSISATGIKGSRLRKFVILSIAISTLGGILIYHLLTDFPLYIAAPLFIITPLIMTMVNSQMLGETGVNIDVNVPLNLIYYASGYSGVEVWFAPTLVNVEGTWWLTNFKVAQLTGASIRDLLKARFILLPLMFLVGYLFVQLYWYMAPIPSGIYPGARIFWRVEAINLAIWIGGREAGLFNSFWLIGSFLVGAAIYSVTTITGFLSAIGLAAGTQLTPHFATTLMIGFLVRIAISRIRGAEWWKQNHRILAAGLAIGTSFAISFSVAISLIVTSIWILPI